MKKKWKSEEDKQRFMASQTGQEWLAKKIAERQQKRGKLPPPPERLTRTKFPFTAIINYVEMVVTRQEGEICLTVASSPAAGARRSGF